MPPRLITSTPRITSFLSLPTPPPRQCTFSTSTRFLADDNDHYATLELPPNATHTEIKRQFYALSKSHHPDLHPSDPDASARFSRISNAYSILANPNKRSTYDRDHSPHRHATAPRSGSYASASYAGSRPASGLSKRRATFRGPPPSFYRQGGRDASSNGNGSSASAPGGGFGPGGASAGLDYDVRHFDRDGHLRTQSGQDIRRSERRSRLNAKEIDAEVERTAGSFLFRFMLVGGVVVFGAWLPVAISGHRMDVKRGNGNANRIGNG